MGLQAVHRLVLEVWFAWGPIKSGDRSLSATDVPKHGGRTFVDKGRIERENRVAERPPGVGTADATEFSSTPGYPRSLLRPATGVRLIEVGSPRPGCGGGGGGML